jgi:hypothetical protein
MSNVPPNWCHLLQLKLSNTVQSQGPKNLPTALFPYKVDVVRWWPYKDYGPRYQ